MKTLKTILAMSVMLTGALCGSVEAAPTWTLTAEGTIVLGGDYAGIFGTADQGFIGMHYTQTITAGTDPAQWTTMSPQYGGASAAMGGSGPGFTETFTVNGTTVSYKVLQTISGAQGLSMEAASQSWSKMDRISSIQYGYDADGNRVAGQIDANTTDPAHAFVSSIDFGQQAVVDVTKANTFGWFSVGGEEYFDVFFGTSIDTVRINETDVPEPATLGLVGLGLAGLGFARRRRQARQGVQRHSRTRV